MEKPKFYRAIVVSLDEARTLLSTVKDERTILQVKRELWWHEHHRYGDPYGDALTNLASIERRLEEVKRHMEAEEDAWEECMREYEDSSDTEQEDEED